MRWRTLISRRLDERGIDFYTQPIQQDRGQVVLQQELLTYIHDEQGRALQAGIFMPMAEKVGLLLPLDRLVAEQTLALLRQRSEQSCPISLTLSAQSLLNREFHRWLFFAMFQLPRSTNERLILQLSESQVTRHFEALKRPLRSLRMLGCLLAIDHAGQDVVSTQYIKEFEINFLKLHPSLVRENPHPSGQPDGGAQSGGGLRQHPHPGAGGGGGEWRRVEDAAPPRGACRSGPLVCRAPAAGIGTG